MYFDEVCPFLGGIFMKAFKKVIAVTLALMLAALVLLMPVSAAKSVPLIIINGFGRTPLVQDYGTEDEKIVFPHPEEMYEEMFTNTLGALIKSYISYALTYDNWEVYANHYLPIIAEYYEDIAYGKDGKPVNEDITNAVYLEPMSAYTDEEKQAIFSDIGIKYAEQYGEDNIYAFGYDWRKSPIDNAAELDEFIEYVKSETGSKKVNVCAMSEGANIMLAYMDEYNTKNLNNVVFASPAWQGTSVIGSLFTGGVEFDIFAVENFLVMLGRQSFVTHFASVLTSWVASYEGLSHEYFAKFNYIIQKLEPRMYSDIIFPIFANMPGLWSFVPGDYYEDAKAYMFAGGENADGFEAPAIYSGLEEKIDAYNEIQANAKQIILDAENNGVKFAIVCGYNCQIAPINETYPTSDTVIDTSYASGGATTALYLQAFDDWGAVHEQVIKDDHNHISWDQRIDASTCMFPEQTWFIKNLEHLGYNADNGTCDLVVWLLGMDSQATIQTDKENYPQFSLYNTYKHTTYGCPDSSDGLLGDVDFSGVVRLDDVRLALQFAAGAAEPDDDQLFWGDIDEDGDITTADAKSILCIAIGIDYEA